MRYYSSWQEALVEFVALFGHNYQDGYNLVAEFEQKLNRNSKGTYFIYYKRGEK